VRISIVIPCLDDREAVLRCVPVLSCCCHEIVIADAGKSSTPFVVTGATVVSCETPGRGIQLNRGASICTGDIIVFNHADTRLEPEHLKALEEALPEDVVGGAFYKALGKHHPKLAWTEPFVRWFTRHFGILYGDQSVFVRREIFLRMGKFREIPLMEDVDFSRRLRAQGKVLLLDPPLETSMRRFRKRGYFRTKVQNMIFVWLFWFGVSPEKLYDWYYRERQ